MLEVVNFVLSAIFIDYRVIASLRVLPSAKNFVSSVLNLQVYKRRNCTLRIVFRLFSSYHSVKRIISSIFYTFLEMSSITAADLKDILQQQQDQFDTLIKSLTGTSLSTSSTAPTASLPKFDAFDKNKEKFSQYVERIQQHFVLNNRVTDLDAQRACLLTSIGSETYQLLKNLYAGEDVTKKTFKELVDKLNAHFKATVNKHAARYQFDQTDLQPGQSYQDWVATLRGLAADCEFICPKSGCCASYTDQMIMDVIIRRTPHAEVRRQCLVDAKLTVESLIEKANMLLRTCSTEKIVQGRTDDKVCKIQPFYKPKKKNGTSGKQKYNKSSVDKRLRGCPGCFTKHEKADCPAKGQVCRKCSGKNHFASVCKWIPKADVCEEVSSLSVLRNDNKIYIACTVNGYPKKFQWDTGASCSMVGLAEYRAIGSPPLLSSSTQLRAYGGHAVPVKGKCLVTVCRQHDFRESFTVGREQREMRKSLWVPVGRQVWLNSIRLVDIF